MLVAQSCLTLCNSMDYSPPGSSAHGILQARILEWVAIPFFRGSSPPRDQTQVSCISCMGRQILYHLSHLGGSKVSVAQDNILVSFTSKSFTWGLLLPRGETPFARGWARQAEEQKMGAGQCLFFSHVLERRFCPC